MIKLTFKDLNNESLTSGLKKMGKATGDTKVVYNVSKILYAVEKEMKLAKEILNKVIAENTEKTQEEQMESLDKFFSHEIVVDRAKVHLESLKGVEFSAHELIALEPFIFSLDTVEAPVVDTPVETPVAPTQE